MSDSNPLIQGSARTTLNNVIELLQFAISSLDNTTKGQTKVNEKHMTALEIAGLGQILRCAKSATEFGFAQCPVETDHDPDFDPDQPPENKPPADDSIDDEFINKKPDNSHNDEHSREHSGEHSANEECASA
jgi:hypothetical protein